MRQASDLSISLRKDKKEKPGKGELVPFGKTFSDHMLTIDWTRQNGWEKPQIIPYGPVKMSLAATVLHYGISAFEGFTAAKGVDGTSLYAFRPEQHISNFSNSSHHLDMP